MVRGMNLRAPCLLSLFGALCLACVTEAAEPAPKCAPVSFEYVNATKEGVPFTATYAVFPAGGAPKNFTMRLAVKPGEKRRLDSECLPPGSSLHHTVTPAGGKPTTREVRMLTSPVTCRVEVSPKGVSHECKVKQ